MGLVWWWLHARPVHWLHGQRGITIEAMVILYGRLVMGLVGGTLVPASIVVFKMVLVMLLVIHLQLAHVGRRWTSAEGWIRASPKAGVRVRCRGPSGRMHMQCGVALPGQRG